MYSVTHQTLPLWNWELLQLLQVQKRFGFPENSVELFAERVESLGENGFAGKAFTVEGESM